MADDPYQVLGVGRTASADEIRKAFRKLAKTLHPDQNPNDKSAEERFKKASGAFDLLSDPEKRAKVESMVLMKRLGGMDEFAHACAPFLDGTSRFTTGQFLSYSGGWS